MTKRELLKLLRQVPLDAEVSIMGGEIAVVALAKDGSAVVLDESDEPFLAEGYDGDEDRQYDPNYTMLCVLD
jgi:hypothetical protein